MVVIAVLGATLATILIIAINDADKEENKNEKGKNNQKRCT